MRARIEVALAGLLASALAAPTGSAAPAFGILQFEIEHNLETPACLTSGGCFFRLGEVEDPTEWLADIRAVSDLATLHWDRAVPWLLFDADPPSGVDPVAYYDARLDAPTRVWIEAFAAQFERMPRGYLAVSLLDGSRDRYSALHLSAGETRRFESTCPSFAPGTVVTIDPGTGPVAFDLARSYRNFVLYLARKLGPDYLALMVEANLLGEKCPNREAGLYSLYRWLHDEVEAALGTGPLLFATLTLEHLLAFDSTACYPTSAFAPCGGPPVSPAFPVSEAVCYPTRRSPIDALSEGGRLDLLALSFYPDGFGMRTAAGEFPVSRVFTPAAWTAGGQCFAVRPSAHPIDPMAAIDRLGWAGPVAIAETSARACATPLYVEVPQPGGGTSAVVLEAPGSPASQAAWVARTYQHAVARDYVFFAHSFLRDYPPIGPWIAEQGVLDPELQALFNLWPCSGFQTPDGAWKPEMLAIGVPEPRFEGGLALGSSLLAGGVFARRSRKRLQSDWRPPMRRAT